MLAAQIVLNAGFHKGMDLTYHISASMPQLKVEVPAPACSIWCIFFSVNNRLPRQVFA